MSLRLYMDHHVPEPITDGLRRRGVDCLTAGDDARGADDDDALLRRATELGRVLFTMDDDFLRLASARWASGEGFGGIIYAHQLHITIGAAVRDLQFLATILDPTDMLNHVERLPL